MIYGIGTDIVQISRVAKKLLRSGDDFAHAILSTQEWDDYQKRQDMYKAAFLAKRFAAKEAFAKAVRTGFRQPNLLNNISVLHDENKAPYFMMSDEIRTATGCPVDDLTVQMLPQFWVRNTSLTLKAEDDKYYPGEYAVFKRLDEENKVLWYWDADGEEQKLDYGL